MGLGHCEKTPESLPDAINRMRTSQPPASEQTGPVDGLSDAQRPLFSEWLSQLCRHDGRTPLSRAEEQGWWERLAPHLNLGLFLRAMRFDLYDRHPDRPFPGPADLLAAATAEEPAPSAAEAWSSALISRDESHTLRLTPDVLEARDEARD